MTINSSDEIETFKEFLPSSKFDFIELLPAEVNEEKDHSSHWFNSACTAGHQCDILVISGHFGGTFFGESGYSLPTELMEEKRCKNTCEGLLSSVKEIFLFGCNTLATKKKDRRTYLEYLGVLLDDGLARETAERVVASRYSPLETPFSQRMNFIFSGSHTIYGFDELSPLGAHIRAPLRRYFQAIQKNYGDYANYLEGEAYKREENLELFEQLPRTHFSLNQAKLSLLNEEEEQKEFFRDKCLLYDSEARFSERMSALQNIFNSGKAGSAFFAIDHFLNRNKRKVLEGAGRKAFRDIRKNAGFKEEFLSYHDHLNFLPYIKMVYLNLLRKFRWLDSVQIDKLQKESLLEVIKKADREAYVSVLLLLEENQVKKRSLYISKKTLPEDYIKSIWGLLIFEKLKVFAPEWQEDILENCKENLKNSPGLCYQSLNTLAHIDPKAKLIPTVKGFLNHKNNEILIYYSLRLLGQTDSKNKSLHKKIASFLNSKSPLLRKEAIEALGFLKSPYPSVQNDLAELLENSKPPLTDSILWSLSQMDVTGEKAQTILLSYAIKPGLDPELSNQIFSTFEKSSSFSDSVIFLFYELLEDQSQTKFLLKSVETLSKNPKLRDLGIHYRFLIFQDKSFAHIKREALKKMKGLTWLHPEVQSQFLNYLKDPELRDLTLQILENITNLEKKHLKFVKTLR